MTQAAGRSGLHRTLATVFLTLAVLGLTFTALAGPLGQADVGDVLSIENGARFLNDRVDGFRVFDDRVFNNQVYLPTASKAKKLIRAGDDALVLVPTDGTLGSDWTATDFDDGTWSSGPTGIGFGNSIPDAGGLEGYWPLEGVEGIAEDLSGNDREGVIVGDALFSPDVPAAIMDVSLVSLELDGTDDMVTITDYKGVTGTGARSVSAWIKGTKANAGVLSWGLNTGGANWTCRVQSGADGAAGAFRVEVNGGFFVATTAVNDGEWHHVVAVFPGDTTPNTDDLLLYVDGELDGEMGGDPAASGFNPRAIDTAEGEDVRIGIDLSNRRFRGFIDEVAIFSHALTAAQVASLADGSRTPEDIGNETNVANDTGTDVGAQMQDSLTSAYIRVPFDVSDSSSLSTLTLRMKYLDGFIAYINGQEVARANAPKVAAWDSVSVVDRVDADGILFEDFDVSSAIGGLVDGTNVLAIHGLSSGTASPNFLIVPEIVSATHDEYVESVTDGDTPGLAYVVTRRGTLYELDWFTRQSTVIADLASLLPDGSTHTRFDSITNLPGSELLYILRTERGTGNPGGVDFIDTFDPTPGALNPYARDVFETSATGTLSISDGPPFAGFLEEGEPAIYSIATGGAFEAFDPAAPGTVGTMIRGGIPAGLIGSFQSLTNLPGDDEHMYLLFNHNDRDVDPADPTDRIVVADLLGAVDETYLATMHTNGGAITDSTLDGFIYSQGTSRQYAHIEVALGQEGVEDFSRTNLNASHSATNLSASSEPEAFVYIADDRAANHFDVHHASYGWQIGSINDVAPAPPTIEPEIGADWADSSLTDHGGSIWQLHTDGKLYRIDPATGESEIVADLDPPEFSIDLGTYESITNLPGDPRLFILRSDRSTSAKTGGGLIDTIDTYDPTIDEYEADLYTTVGTDSISITDGPAYNSGAVLTAENPAVYLIATGGSFEVLDPNQPDALELIRTGFLDAKNGDATGAGRMISVTNLPGDDEHLYVLRDTSSGPDTLDVLDLEGGAVFNALVLNGTGAKTITDTNEGRLYANATGGAANLIEVDINDPRDSIVHMFSNGTATNQVSVTNLEEGEIVDPPGPLCETVGLTCVVTADDPQMITIDVSPQPGDCDCSSVEIFIDGQSVGTQALGAGGIVTIPAPAECAPGPHTLELVCRDRDGREGGGGVCQFRCDGEGEGTPFRRGDADGSGDLQLTDAVNTLNFLFTGGATPRCSEAADTDNNGRIELTDGIVVLNFLFLGGTAPAAPGHLECGADPDEPGSAGDIGCEQYDNC